MSNIFLIRFLIIIRILFWYSAALTCVITRTVFIVQTWSKTMISIFIIHFFFSIINFFTLTYPGYYQKLKYILIICLSLLILSTMIIYILYIFYIYYRIMDLLIINIMTNNRNESLLSETLHYHQCCRIQEEILFDSVNERDYFILFPYCEKVILENEMKKDHWDHITTCGGVFRSIVFYIRIFFILDFLLNLILTIRTLFYIWEVNEERIVDNLCTLLISNKINYKIK